MSKIPFNVPPIGGRELEYLAEVINRRSFSGDGVFTAKCQQWLKDRISVDRVLLTNSCTAALEMAAILAELEPGDEVIMPSFTFVSTANAVVLRGATPVFVDIRPDTQNIDETLVESAITSRTKAICAVHYGGVCAEMNVIGEIAKRNGLLVIEDAAQALLSTYHGRQAGNLGDLGCFSFHETKNVTAGEGGALTICNPRFSERSHVVWEKGTNRHSFKLGAVDKYTWIDCGSSFLPSEFMAAILFAQLEHADRFNSERRANWDRYHKGFHALQEKGLVRCPVVPPHCEHNGHLYYLILRDQVDRDRFIQYMATNHISSVFHYVPLHSAPAGQRFARTHGDLKVTETTSASLVRLPLHSGMQASVADQVIEQVHSYFA